MRSAGVRFKIRSVKERQMELSNGSHETEKVSRRINERSEDRTGVFPYSYSSPDPDISNKEMPRKLNQVSLTKKQDLQDLRNKMCKASQWKSDFEELPTEARGRTEERQAPSYRSKSLDWRGTRGGGRKENLALVIRDTIDIERRFMRQSESSETKEAVNRPNTVKLASQSNKTPLQFSVKKDVELPFSSNMSSVSQGDPVSVRSPTTKVMGKTEWRQAMFNRSNSLDWRRTRGEGTKETALVLVDTIDFEGSSIKHSENVLRKQLPNRLNLNELSSTSKKTPLQDIVSKDAELPFSSDMSTATQGNPVSVRSPATKVRGRTEWRTATSNRSKSLDWGGKRGEGRTESQALVIRDTIDFEDNARRLSESIERKETFNRANLNERSGSSNKALLQFRDSEDSEFPFSSEMGYTTQGKTNDETSTIKARGRSEWRQAKPNRSKSLDWKGDKNTRVPVKDFTDYKGSSTRYSESAVKKKIPNAIEQTIPPKRNTAQRNTFSAVSSAKTARLPLALEQARGGQSLSFRLQQKHTEDNTEDRKSPWWNSGQGNPKTDHQCRSQANRSDVKELTGDHIVSETNNVFNVSEDNFASVVRLQSSSNGHASNLKYKKSIQDSLVEGTPTSLSNMTHVSYDAEKGGTFPRISSKGVGFNFGPIPDAIPSGKETMSAWSMERPSGEESSYVLSRNSKSGGSAGLGTHSLDRVGYRHCRPAIPKSVTTESSYSSLRSNKSSNSIQASTKTREGLQETFQAPPSDSVRNKIHKFEALFKQNQSPSYMLHSQRAFPFQEKSKNYTENSLSLQRGERYTECLKENLLSNSDMVDSIPDSAGFVKIAKTSVKTQSKTTNSQDSGAVQSLKLPEELLLDQQYKTRDSIKHDTKITTRNSSIDEPDFSIVGQHKPKNTAEAKKRSHRSGNVSLPDIRDYSNSNSEPKPSFQNYSISKSNHKAFQISKITSLFSNSEPSTSVKSPSKSQFSPFSNLSASDDLKNICNTLSDERAAAKVSRWIMGDRDGFNTDDENYEDEDDESTVTGDDSDSGDSSVTITSNKSHTDHPSFSVSLVDLCSLGGLDYPPPEGSELKNKEYWMSKRTSSLNSDVSSLSTVTLLGNEELDRLLDDVRDLGNYALQNYEDIQVVVLHKEVGNGLGFTVAGGVDQNKPVTVHRVIPCGVAAQEGSVHKGDHVLSVNGTALHNSTHKEALHTLKRARKRGMAVVVVRRGDIAEAYNSSTDSLQKGPGNTGSKVRVTLLKSSRDLGFSLEGGVGSSLGDKPLTVNRLFQDGPVGKVFAGDELLEVGGQSLSGLRRLEAWNLIKRLPPGPVEVLLQRSHQPH